MKGLGYDLLANCVRIKGNVPINPLQTIISIGRANMSRIFF